MDDAMKDKWILRITSLFGAGRSPVAPGTAGTAAALVVYALMRYLPTDAYVLVTVALMLAGVYIAGETERITRGKDPGICVFDELIGLLITCFGFNDKSFWLVAILGFFVFRLFDVVKIWPATYFDQRVTGGAGVILDDVAAGIYANIALRLLFWFFALFA